jgi:hypothetical protein
LDKTFTTPVAESSFKSADAMLKTESEDKEKYENEGQNVGWCL